METLRIPPHSIEAEQALISAVLADNQAVHELDWITESDFYRTEHVIIWRKIQSLTSQALPVDPVVLIEALDNSGDIESAGGQDYLVDLAINGRGSANAQHYAQIIRDKAIGRRIISIGSAISDIGFDSIEAQNKIDKAQSLMMAVETKSSSEPEHIGSIIRKTIEGIDKRFHHKGEIIGLETGFIDLDKATCGLSPGDMVVVAGRPSMGKTTFAMNIAERAALNDKFVIVFSLEMSKDQLNLRNLSSVGGISHERLRSGKLQEEDWPGLTSAAARLKTKALYVDDDGSITSAQVLSRSRKIANKAGRQPDLIVIDYMQLLNDEGEGTARMTQISRRLKLVATSLKCPLIALSQLNRSVESRPLDKRRPVMADLRESGAIEQDADIVIMLYRDDVYNDRSKMAGIGEAIIRKQRNGPLTTVYLQSQLNYSRFANNIGYMPPAGYYSDDSDSGRGFSA